MTSLCISAFIVLMNGNQLSDSVALSSDSMATERENESADEDNLLDQFQTESDNLQVLDDLTWRREHPFDLNTVGAEELETIPGVTPREASAIVAYRNVIKDFVSVSQLDLIEGGLCDKCSPYVRVTTNRDDQHIQFRSRTIRDLQPRRGDLDSTFLGSSLKTYNRLIIAGGDFQAGALFEKDGGEQFSSGFVSGYVAVKDVGVIQQVIVGDFNVDAGQGLVMWRGSAFGKGGEAIGVAKSGLGVQPYRSTDEFNFLRGAAASTSIEMGMGKINATVFVSRRLLDGSVDTSEGVSSFYEEGLFRTQSELGKRKAVSERLIGGRFEFSSSDHWRVGSIAYHTTFDKPIIAGTAFDFVGKELTVTGVDAAALLGRLSAFGEIARSGERAFAGIVGAIVNMGNKSNIALVYREYGAAFNNFHATGFGERSDTKNERGLYVGFDCLPLKWLKFSGYVDQFRFAWRTFSNPLPTTGHEILAQAEAAVAPKLGLTLRFTHKSTEETAVDVDPFGRETRPIVDHAQQKYRLTVTYKATPRVHVKGRLEFTQIQCSLLNTRERGYMLYEDIRWNLPKKLTIEGRLAFFQTDSYDSRIYEYENDLRGVFSNPALYGKGRRWYLMIRYNVTNLITLAVKYSETQKEGVTSLGSGITEIIGDVDNRVSLQFDLHL